MRTRVRHVLPARAALLAAALLVLLPAGAAAHAEFASSSPADGETVEGTPAEISAEFTEALGSDSTFELLDATGAVVAEGAIDPANDQRMVIDPPDLAPGTYEVRWLASADDGHLERGTYEFTIAAASTQAPTASAQPSESAAATAALTVGPSVAASPTDDLTSTATTTDVLIPIIAAVVILAVLAGYLLNRRRTAPPA
jgi:methionine-rich copper-binding protein CopC